MGLLFHQLSSVYEVQGASFRIQGSGHRVQGVGLKDKGARSGGWEMGIRDWGSETGLNHIVAACPCALLSSD